MQKVGEIFKLRLTWYTSNSCCLQFCAIKTFEAYMCIFVEPVITY